MCSHDKLKKKTFGGQIRVDMLSLHFLSEPSDELNSVIF